jgi:RimJ/RimL family protein N-acetyltransferase
MNQIKFNPRWKEELVTVSDEGILIFELSMGTLHVYFPDEEKWLASVPDWLKKNGRCIWMPVLTGANKTRSRCQLLVILMYTKKKKIPDMKTIESERLFLRPLTLEDAGFILQLLNTDGFIKYIGDRSVKTIQQAINYLLDGPLKSYETNGFGLSLVELKTDRTPVGMCGLLIRGYLDHPDIGFAFLPDHTGKGYAYEIVKEIIHYGLHGLQMEKILAIVLPENSSSIKLLEKVGFRYEKNFISPDSNEELRLYSIKTANSPD